MQSTNPFQRTEDEYFRLKGQLAAGRITREQFDAALKNLMVQDAQGRWWMMGADSGKWYVSDGQNWVEANPSGIAPVRVDPMPTRVPPPAPTRSQRASSGGCCGPCLAALIVILVALVLLGAAFYSNLPQLKDRVATAVATLASATPKPALNLCTLMPPGTPKTTDKVGVYTIPNTWGSISPRRACYIPLAEGEPRILIEQFATPEDAQRMEKQFQVCPSANSACTITAINLGDGGTETESPMDPECELKIPVHQLKWRRGCFVIRVEIYTRPITPVHVKQLWDWARPLDAKLQTLSTCPE
jgi:hypothetical protein